MGRRLASVARILLRPVLIPLLLEALERHDLDVSDTLHMELKELDQRHG